MMQSEFINQLYIALIPQGDEFVEVNDFESEINHPSDVTALGNYIKHHFEPIEGKVSIGGNIYFTTIYKPKSGDDFFYVITDTQKIPFGAEVSRAERSVEIDAYLNTLVAFLSKAEAFSEEMELSIDDYFVKPYFKYFNLQKKKTISWDYLSTFSRLMIVGSPGSGKTTCLRKLALDFAREDNVGNLGKIIPVYFSMREFGKKEFSFASIQEILSSYSAPRLAELAPTLIDKGGLVLLMDGLDEINDKQRSRILNQLRDTCQKYPRLRMIITMRYGGKHEDFDDFTQLEVEPFNNAQIRHWTYQVIQNEKPWKRFFDHLIETPAVLNLARNPLMLATAVALYLRYSHTPHNRTDLLERYLNMLIEEWDAVRSINRSNEIWSSPSKKLFYLCNIAYHLSVEDKQVFSLNDFKKWSLDERFDEKLLSSLAEDTGLLKQSTRDQWCFTHESFLQYLTARYLVDCTLDINQILGGKLKEPRYQKIWLDVCGIAYDPIRLIDSMLQSTEITPLLKLSMLSSLLSEEIKVKEDFLDKYVEYIKTGIEEHLKDANSADVTIGKLDLEVNVMHVCAIEFKTDSEQISKSDLPLFFELIKNVYKLKTSHLGQLFKQELSTSAYESVRHLSSLFYWNGHLRYKLKEYNNKTLLVFYAIDTMNLT